MSSLSLSLLQENILIDGRGSAALCDFGLSMAMDGGATGYTSSEVAGTLRYLAPELLEEKSVRTLGTDVYALGCTCMQVGKLHRYLCHQICWPIFISIDLDLRTALSRAKSGSANHARDLVGLSAV